MQKNKDKQYLSVVQMDDPVMILAVKEGLLEPLTPAKVPNLAALKPGTDPHGRHVGELPAALARHRLQQGHEDGPDVVGRALRSEVQGPRHPALAAEHRRPGQPVHGRACLATGKPMPEAQNDIDAGFKKLVDPEAEPADDLHAACRRPTICSSRARPG